MPTRTLLECSVCRREMPGPVTVEVRLIVSVADAQGGPTREDCRRLDVCSPACGLTGARQVIEGAWG